MSQPWKIGIDLTVEVNKYIYVWPLALITLFPTSDLATGIVKLLIVAIALWVGRDIHCSPDLSMATLLFGWLVLSGLWSMNSHATLQGVVLATYYALLYSIFRTTLLTRSSVVWGCRILVLVAFILSVDDGLRQVLSGYTEHLQYLERQSELLQPSTSDIMRNWVQSLSGRVFSRFLLPSQLAGYLLMILPLNVVLLIRERPVAVKIGWGIVLALNGLIFLYTKSFGAWLTLLGMLAIGGLLLLSRRYSMTWRTVCIGGLGLLGLAIGILFLIGRMRGQYLWNLTGNNPLWYRFLNWKIAVAMFRDHLWLGAGFLTFGKMYPQYMLPGANESQYVHNTYLQFGAELGILGAVLVLWLVGSWINNALAWFRSDPDSATPRNFPLSGSQQDVDLRLSLFLSGIGFLLHNIVDFDFYVFPLGLLGLALLALTVNPSFSPAPTQPPKLRRPSLHSAYYWGIACGLVVVCGLDWQISRGRHAQQDAQDFIQRKQYQEAYTAIQAARQAAPFIPEYLAAEGAILHALQRSAEAIPRLETAITQEPATPWMHATLAEAYLATQNVSMAYLESRRAAELFPQRKQYQQWVEDLQATFSFH